MPIPLREPTFLILTALTTEPLHGYGIVRAVAELSADRVRLQAGTLYGALDRLKDDGWIELDREDVVEGRLRRYYKLTDTGAGVLADETARLRANADAATAGLRARAARGGLSGFGAGPAAGLA
ncbi:helix-turn-helix transcriptional regulator [Lentzea sp. BCCO 10_0856]|uniref:Helix-turn-helix transcriptional regulator n=1 Tax=Lentzea miocenica TaxID=3095431 RepID=A0ABU4SVH5_9PSEU|nr:helix-turn-helix transcriptional regulator [Lentzea sp. BCCO 10_0856]MDX8029906.1 helix-turn-helix transcriptional regulator [Lentzea sp. BCCO 10_0856]